MRFVTIDVYMHQYTLARSSVNLSSVEAFQESVNEAVIGNSANAKVLNNAKKAANPWIKTIQFCSAFNAYLSLL